MGRRTIRMRATSKASLLRALSATGKSGSSVRVIKRAGKHTTGIYSIRIKKKKRKK